MAFTILRRAASRSACQVAWPRRATRSTARQIVLRCTRKPKPSCNTAATSPCGIPSPLFIRTANASASASGPSCTAPPLPGHQRSVADPALARVAHICGSDRRQYQRVSRWSSAPPRVDTAARFFLLSERLRSHIARAAARRSLDRLAAESFCGNAGRRRYRACALVAWGWLSADRGKRVRLVACWPAGLLLVGASAFRLPHATVLVPHEDRKSTRLNSSHTVIS